MEIQQKTMKELSPNGPVKNIVHINDKEGRLRTRSKIDYYEQSLKKEINSETGIMDEVNDNGLKEHFIGGAYIRELFIPAGITIVSKLWNKERFWIIASGDVSIMTETETKRVTGPHTEVPPFGSKTALYAHTDTLWFAITGSNSKTSEEVEEELLAKDYSELTYPWRLL